jgi:hypothetical protein
MTTAELVAALGAIVEAVKEFPELVIAVEGLFGAVSRKEDLTPAMKHLEVVAAAKALGIPF